MTATPTTKSAAAKVTSIATDDVGNASQAVQHDGESVMATTPPHHQEDSRATVASSSPTDVKIEQVFHSFLTYTITHSSAGQCCNKRWYQERESRHRNSNIVGFDCCSSCRDAVCSNRGLRVFMSLLMSFQLSFTKDKVKALLGKGTPSTTSSPTRAQRSAPTTPSPHRGGAAAAASQSPQRVIVPPISPEEGQQNLSKCTYS